MTNVPQNIREMWTDLYKLFDMNYLMEGTDDDWKRFYLKGKELFEKYGQNPRFMDGVMFVSDMISDRLRAIKNAENS